MKKIAYIIIMIFVFIRISSLEVDKISEFSLSEYYPKTLNKMLIHNNYLYTVTGRSLQIFDVQDESLDLVIDFEMQGELRYVTAKTNFAYVATSGATSRLYRINISNPLAPVVTDTLFFLGSYVNFTDGNYVFINELHQDATWSVHVYDNFTFNEITEFDLPQLYWAMHKVTNGIATVPDGDTFYLYNIINPNEIEILASNDVENISSPYKTSIIQDTIFAVTSGLSNFKMYDFSEPYAWEQITEIEIGASDFRICDDRLVLFKSNELWLYDISDLFNPNLLAQYDSGLMYNPYTGVTLDDNKLFMTVKNGTLFYYDISNDNFEEIDYYHNYGRLWSAYKHNDFLYIQYFMNGLSTWDISNIEEPVSIDTIFTGNIASYYLDGDEDILIYQYEEFPDTEFHNIVFRIEDNGDLSELDRITTSTFPHILHYKEGLGFFSVYGEEMHKFIFNEDEELEEVAAISVPGVMTGRCFFKDNVMYCAAPYNLVTFQNIDSNDNMEVSSIIDWDLCSIATGCFYGQYIFLSEITPVTNCKIFDISTPSNPDFVTSIANCGFLGIDEENQLLFIGNNICTVYDLQYVQTGYIPEICYFQNWSWAEEIIPFQINENNYLLYLEDTSANIFQYYPDNEVIENYEISFDFSLLNYPNPVKTENGFTTIKYQIPTSCQVELSVYNVKGQLIKRIINEYQKKGYYNIEWDGKDNYEKKVSSGQYFITLDVNNETKAVRKMILLR